MKSLFPTIEPPSVRRFATLSDCGKYRYRLGRQWSQAAPVLFIGLNPSTADADKDDPTVRRMMGFARAMGAGGILIGNLSPYRATNPMYLPWSDPPEIERENLRCIADMATGNTVIVAWGSHSHGRNRVAGVMATLGQVDCVPQCFGLTGNGSPKHLLYLRSDLRPMPFEGAK